MGLYLKKISRYFQCLQKTQVSRKKCSLPIALRAIHDLGNGAQEPGQSRGCGDRVMRDQGPVCRSAPDGRRGHQRLGDH